MKKSCHERNIRKLLLRALAEFLVFTMLLTQTTFAISTGSGDSELNPYTIGTAEELLEFANFLNEGNSINFVALTADIDMSTVCSTTVGSWTPISNGTFYSFDGRGHVIRNLYIDNPEEDYQGLFGHLDREQIKNLGLLDCYIRGRDSVGGIVGSADYAELTYCFVTGTIEGNTYVGGLYGHIGMASPSNNISAAKVSGNSQVGIIAGSLSQTAFSDSIGLKYNSIPLFGEADAMNEINNVVEYDDFTTGEACYNMNDNSSKAPTWFQNIGEEGDECPVLDSTHGVVYRTESGYASCSEHSSNSDGFCSICGCYIPNGLKPNANGVYEIDNANKLVWFANSVNKGNYNANAILTSDIDLSTVCGEDVGSWIGIGTDDVDYYGSFDGDYHTISNLYSDASDCYNGLFGRTDKTTIISNINIENAILKTTVYTGIIASYNYGIIRNCSVSGSVTATGNYLCVGGISAINSWGAQIIGCHNKATISVTGNSNNVGGVCGKNLNSTTPSVGNATCGTVNYSLNTGSLTATGESNLVGPIIGYNSNAANSIVLYNIYLDDSETDSLDGTKFMTEAQFLSGEAAYYINSHTADSTQPWYQTCYSGYPEIKGKTVYAYTNCQGVTDYTNNAELSGTSGQHDYIDGFCRNCSSLNLDYLQVDQDGYYVLDSIGDLKWFSAYVNTENASANALLDADLSIDNSFTPIGANEYTGVFDGQGHTVTFNVTDTNEAVFYGLFSRTTTGASISDLKLAGSITSPEGWDRVGALVGQAFATPISQVTSTVTIENRKELGYTGGLVGYYGGRDAAIIENCSVIADVMGTYYVGGLIGAGWDATRYYTIKNSFYVGDVKSIAEPEATDVSVGAIVGCSMTNNNGWYDDVTFNAVYYNTVDQTLPLVGLWDPSNGVSSEVLESSAQIDYTERVTAEQLADGSVAWLLNTQGGSNSNNDMWSQGTEYPIYADISLNRTVCRIEITGAVEKAYYQKSGEIFTLPENIHVAEYTGPFTVTADTSLVSDAAIIGVKPSVTDSITFDYVVVAANDLTPTLDITFGGETVNLSAIGIDDGTYKSYSFIFEGILPQQMAENIAATLTINGTAYAAKSEYSVQAYVFNRLSANSSEAEREFLVNMLYYGAAAQQQHNVTMGLATEGLSELLDASVIADYRTSETVWETLEPTTVKDRSNNNDIDAITWESATLVFDKTITMRLRFKTADITALDGTVFDSSFGDDVAISDAVYETDTNSYYIDITNFKPTDYDTVVTVALVNAANETISETVTYSVMSYIASKKNSDSISNLVRALYDYGMSGESYIATIG